MVEGEYPQAEVCGFQWPNRCRSAAPTCPHPQKVHKPHPNVQNLGRHRESGLEISFSKTW